MQTELAKVLKVTYKACDKKVQEEVTIVIQRVLQEIKEKVAHSLLEAELRGDPTHLQAKVIGAKIKELRKKTGLNQEEFGKKIGITNQLLSRIETGEIAFATLEKYLNTIAKELGVTSDELLQVTTSLPSR